MREKICVEIDKDIMDKFNLALQLTGEDQDIVFTDMMKNYVLESFSNAAKSMGKNNQIEFNDNVDPNYKKGVRKLSIWAQRPKQNNYKIIRAFLQLQEENETVFLEDMKKRCNDPDRHMDVYVPTFITNFAQMKFDGAKSNGKIFEVSNVDAVTIWDEAIQTVEIYKDKFLEIHSTETGYENKNGQVNIGKTEKEGTGHMQYLYEMECKYCHKRYYANGHDIFLKKCPSCQGGADIGK